jgi:hypothetical protein
MVMNIGAADRSCGGGQRPVAADLGVDVAQDDDVRATVAAYSAAATSTVPPVVGTAGVRGAPAATERRFQTLQPAP